MLTLQQVTEQIHMKNNGCHPWDDYIYAAGPNTLHSDKSLIVDRRFLSAGQDK